MSDKVHANKWNYSLLFFITLLSTLSMYQYHRVATKKYTEYLQPTSVIEELVIAENSSIKYILAWTKWNAGTHNFDANPVGWFNNCPESRCVMGSNRSRKTDADAIIFYIPDFNYRDLPHRYYRNKKQYYIFHLLESPDTTKELMDFRKWDVNKYFFNLTFTYRLDSDVFDGVYLHGYQPHIMNISQRDPLWYFGRRDVLWMVGHCRTASKREDYVAELRQHIQVDVVGKCDQLLDPCTSRKCSGEKDIMSKYKFYLSFENSVCKDYATEKLARALNNDVVPIVMGGVRYDLLFPPKAVINVEDYSSPKELADYLKYLIKNETAYEEHLSWKYPGKPIWHLPDIPNQKQSGFCRLCEYLHRPPKKRIHRSYFKMVRWWFKDQCRKPFSKKSDNYTENILREDSSEQTTVI